MDRPDPLLVALCNVPRDRLISARNEQMAGVRTAWSTGSQGTAAWHEAVATTIEAELERRVGHDATSAGHSVIYAAAQLTPRERTRLIWELEGAIFDVEGHLCGPILGVY